MQPVSPQYDANTNIQPAVPMPQAAVDYPPQPMIQPVMQPQPVQPVQIQVAAPVPVQSTGQRVLMGSTVGDAIASANVAHYMVGVPLVNIDSLTTHGALVVKQDINALKILCGFSGQIHFDVYDVQHQRVGYIQEDTPCCSRCCCPAANRSQQYTYYNAQGAAMLRVEQGFSCCASLAEATISVPLSDGKSAIIGYVRNRFSCCAGYLELCDESHQAFAMIYKRFLLFLRDPTNQTMYIFPGNREDEKWKTDSNAIGKITNAWHGLLPSMFLSDYDADTFVIEFPAIFDSKKRAILYAAITSLNARFFEADPSNQIVFHVFLMVKELKVRMLALMKEITSEDGSTK